MTSAKVKPDPALEEAAAIAALIQARVARQRAKRVEIADQRDERRLAPEQRVSLARAWAELAKPRAAAAATGDASHDE
jgi:hypothetical protein